MYVPFWMYDGEASGSVEFHATTIHKYTSGDYEVTEISHYDVRRAGSVSFEKIPVDASSKMPDDYMDSIEPFNYADLKPFSTAYLPGFLADKYDVSVEDSRERADKRCAGSLVSALERTVSGYTSCNETSRDIHLKRGKVHYALLDPEYKVGGKRFPLCHERSDRQAGRQASRQHETGRRPVCSDRGTSYRNQRDCAAAFGTLGRAEI